METASTVRRDEVVVRLTESQAEALGQCGGIVGTPDPAVRAEARAALEAIREARQGPTLIIGGNPPVFTVRYPDGRVSRGYSTLIEALDAIEVWASLR